MVSGRYREILIDEYQDCSAVQEILFNAVSREGRNIFMVGDVKQSNLPLPSCGPGHFSRQIQKLQGCRDRGGKQR